MNPSTEDMLNAIEQVNAKNIFILPNNKNIILAAEQARDSRFYASLCKSWWLKTGESCRTVRLFLKR